MEIHQGLCLLMPLFANDGWVLSSRPRDLSRWEMSTAAQESTTACAVPILYIRLGTSLRLFFCHIPYSSVSSLSSRIGILLCIAIFLSIFPVERSCWLPGMCFTSWDQLFLFGSPSGDSFFLYPDLYFCVWFLILLALHVHFDPFFCCGRIFFLFQCWLHLLISGFK